MRSLVGYTGFVGGNLLRSGYFDFKYNSKNIEDSYATKPDILFFSGLRAEKFLANTDPEADRALVEAAAANIERIEPKSIVLISTADVYKSPAGVDEDTPVDIQGLHPYGLNRYSLEEYVKSRYSDHLIVRLPGLFGEGIKKNFIYDMIHYIPTLLSEEKLRQLGFINLSQYYERQDNGFYRLKSVDAAEREALKGFFKKAGFSALNFTDSRARFQFYDLADLYNHIEVARGHGIRLLNLATEPCEAGELYSYIFGESFINELNGVPSDYDMRSIHANTLGGANGYFLDRASVKVRIKDFVIENIKISG